MTELLLVSITPLEPDRAILGIQEAGASDIKYFVVNHNQLLTFNHQSADVLLKRENG